MEPLFTLLFSLFTVNMINPSLLTSEKPLKVRTGARIGDKVKLVFSDNQSVEISCKFLPKGTREGVFLYLDLLSGEDLQRSKNEVAKEILSEILNPNGKEGE